MAFTRRDFLQQASGAVAAAGLLTKIPTRRLWASPASEFMPRPDEQLMQQLALKGIEAARAAGAQFADIRVMSARYILIGSGGERRPDIEWPQISPPMIGFERRFGIRVLVDGVWGFANETVLDVDTVAQVARTAVVVARSNKARHRKSRDLAPVPSNVVATWAAPIEIDPLTISMKEMGQLCFDGVSEAFKNPETYIARYDMSWRQPVTVFASSDGALITQRHCSAQIGGEVTSKQWGKAGPKGGNIGPYGYEGVDVKNLVANMAEAARLADENGKKRVKLPIPVEYGKYDIVMSASAVGSILSGTLNAALAADYASGNQANERGVSFAGPPLDYLGKYQIASPLITLRADRSRPKGCATVGYDEEGVKPDEYTLVDKGVIVDYHNNRETAAEMAPYYQRSGKPVRSHGVMRRTGGEWPEILTPNLTLEPGSQEVSVDDMVKDVKKGLLIETVEYGNSDQQTISAQYSLGAVRLIRNGKLGDYVKQAALQLITTSFWKSIDAIGGKSSATEGPSGTDGQAILVYEQPFPYSTFSLVPARARKANILNTGRTW